MSKECINYDEVLCGDRPCMEGDDERTCTSYEQAEEGTMSRGIPDKVKKEFDSVVDSGERQEFDTGSVRDTQDGKGRYDLISPISMKRLALHFENGAKKYGDHNWQKGQPLMRYMDSAIRHLYAYIEGNRDEDHMAAAAWNALAVIHTEEMIARGELPAELDNLPNYSETEDEIKSLQI